MRAHVVFNYPVRYIPARCHNSRSASFLSATDLDIAEVAEDRIDPAFEVTSASTPRFAPIDGRPCLIVAHDGLLWREWGAVRSLAESLEANPPMRGTPFDAAKHLTFRDATNNPPRQLAADTLVSLQRYNAVPFREFEDDGGAAMAALLRRRAADMIIVGDRVYVRDYEPCWKSDHRGLSVGAMPPDPGDPFESVYRDYLLYGENLWRADRLSDALNAAGDGTGVRDCESIRVINPAYVRLADDSRALAAAAKQVTRHLSDHLAELPWEFVDAFYGIRDALAVTGNRAGPSVVSAMSAFVAAGGISRPSDQNAASRLEDALSECRDVLARWDLRPDDGLEWVHHGLAVTRTARAGGGTVREVLDADAADVLSRAVRRDLADMVRAARLGEGRLLAIDGPTAYPARPAEAAVLVAGTEIAAMAIGPGLALDAASCAAIAMSHIERASRETSEEPPVATWKGDMP